MEDNILTLSSSCVESKYHLIIITTEPVQLIALTLAQSQSVTFQSTAERMWVLAQFGGAVRFLMHAYLIGHPPK